MLIEGGAAIGKRLFVGNGIVSGFNSNTIGSIFTTGGNVGIGTISPSYNLDVAGTLNATDVTISSLIISSTTNATTTSSAGVVVSGGMGITKNLLVGGNVNVSGISTQFAGSFAAANNVVSATDIAGFLLANSVFGSFTSSINVKLVTLTQSLNAQYYIEGTQTSLGWIINDSIFGDDVGITFTITSNGQLQYTSVNQTNWISTTINYQVTGINLATGYNAIVPTSGNAVISGNLSILSTMDANTASSASLSLSGGLSVIKSVFVGGNVGINTTSPGHTLDVNGGIRAITSTIATLLNTNAVSTNISVGTINASTGITVASAQITNANVTTSTIATARITTSLLALGDSNTIGSMFTTGGNVGIGTTSPGSALHVAGSMPIIPSGNGLFMGIDVNNNSGIQINSGTNGSVNHEYIDFSYNGGEFVSRIINSNANRNLDFIVNGGTLSMSLQSTGNVNITNAVSTNISSGTVNASTGITAASAQLTNANITTATVASLLNTNLTAGIARITTNLAATGNSNTVGAIITTGGNVGINTTAPGSILDVVSSSPILTIRDSTGGGGRVFFGNSSHGAGRNAQISTLTDANDVTVWTGGTGSVGFATSLTERMRINASGNVGIGKTNPAYKLDVNGSIICSDWFRSSGATGWFNQTYSRGIYVNDATWVRTYPDRSAFLCGTLNCNDITTNNNAIGMGSGSINFSNDGAGLNWGSNFSQIYDDGDLRIKTDDNMRLFCGGSEVITLTPSTTTINTRTYINHSASGNVIPLGVYAPNIGGYQPWVVSLLGKTESTDYGVAVQGYYYAGSGSTSNYYFIGFNGKSYDTESFKVYPGGSIAKTGGTFDIIHPIKNDPKKRLIHSFVEGPRCDLIYRGSVQLVNGTATVNIDSDCVCKPESAMSQGTFEALVTNPDIFLQNKSSFDQIIGSISGNVLTIVSNNTASNAMISWMVIGERKDAFIKQWNRTNSDGYLVTEYTQE
jgi:hypothetical protein